MTHAFSLLLNPHPNVPSLLKKKTQWESTRQRLLGAGLDVDLIESLRGDLRSQYGMFSRNARLVRVALADVTQPTDHNLRTLLHEMGHAVLGTENEALVRATDSLAVDLIQGDTVIDVETNAEEALVEAIAKRLQDEGFTGNAQTTVQWIVRSLKHFVTRTYVAIQDALLGPKHVNPAVALAYFENRVKQFLANDRAAYLFYQLLWRRRDHLEGPARGRHHHARGH